MTQSPQMATESQLAESHLAESQPWATGLAIFAGALMMTVGIFQLFQGLVALIDDEFYVVVANYTFELDVTTWGWVHAVFGGVLAVAGLAVLRGMLWARMLGVVLAALSTIANFLWIPYYPLWSLVIIALNVAVIWALCVYRPREV